MTKARNIIDSNLQESKISMNMARKFTRREVQANSVQTKNHIDYLIKHLENPLDIKELREQIIDRWEFQNNCKMAANKPATAGELLVKDANNSYFKGCK